MDFSECIKIINPKTLDKLKEEEGFRFCKTDVRRRFQVSQSLLNKVLTYFNYPIEPLTRNKKFTQDEWVQVANVKHDYFYDYSLVNYVNGSTKVKIICPIHGVFEQGPLLHSNRGDGCPKCGKESMANKSRTSVEDFIKKSREIHGDRYDYSLVRRFKTLNDKLNLVCPKHGVFEQSGLGHLQGLNCEKCSYEERAANRIQSKESILERLKKMCPNLKYDLSNYKNRKSVIKYKCKEHGWVEQELGCHLVGKDCKYCNTTNGGKPLTTEQFIENARRVHGDRYDYSEVVYVNNSKKVKIKCKHHGYFYQKPNGHVDSQMGCSVCARVSSSFRRGKVGSDITEEARNIENFLYILKMSKGSEEFWKIGTSSNPQKRATKIKGESGYEVRIEKVFKSNIFDAVTEEQKILKKFKRFKHKPKNYFVGETECFNTSLPIKDVIEEIEKSFNTKKL